VNSSLISNGSALRAKRIKINKRYLIQDISNLISNPNPKIIMIVIILTIIADLDESMSGESKKLINPRPAEIKSKFDDLM